MSVQAITCALAVRGVSASEKLLLLVLANYADEGMRCWPSQRRLAAETGLSDRTVRALLTALEEKRFVSRREVRRGDGSRSSDVVTLHFSGMVVTGTERQPEIISGGAEIISRGAEAASGGAEMASRLTTFEPSIKPPSSSSDAPEVDWSARLKEATEAAGDGLDRTSPSVHAYSALRQLCEPTSGEPCLWSEVMDAVRIESAKAIAKKRPIRAWGWVKEAALAIRDRRLQGLPAVSEVQATGPPRRSWSEQANDVQAEAVKRILGTG